MHEHVALNFNLMMVLEHGTAATHHVVYCLPMQIRKYDKINRSRSVGNLVSFAPLGAVVLHGLVVAPTKYQRLLVICARDSSQNSVIRK